MGGVRRPKAKKNAVKAAQELNKLEQEVLAFKEAAAEPLPLKICVGYVVDVGEPKVTATKFREDGYQKTNYINQPIMIAGLGSSPNTKLNWLYRPEWLSVDFDPEKLGDMIDDEKEAKAVHFVYSRNIRGRQSTSVLQGLCGNKENFQTLSGRLLSLKEPENMDAVRDVLSTFFLEDVSGNPIGYKLRQKFSKTGEVDDNGKAVYIADNRYEISEFFEYSEELMEKFRAGAEKSQGRVRVCWDGEPF